MRPFIQRIQSHASHFCNKSQFYYLLYTHFCQLFLMPYIKGMLGSKVIAEENINESSLRKQRKLDDPIRYIHIDCKIPQNIKYNVGSMDIFNFAQELQKIPLVPYQDVLKLEGEFNDAFANFKY